MSTLGALIDTVAQLLGRSASSIDPRAPLSALFADDRSLFAAVEEFERRSGRPLLGAGQFARAGSLEALASLTGDPVVPVAPGAAFPLTSAQQFTWLRLNHPSLPAPSTARALRLSGAVDVAALQAAFGRLGAQHPALQLAFNRSGADLEQTLSDRPAPTLRTGTLPTGPGSLEERERDAISAELALPFDLREGALLRGALLTEGEGQSLLVVTAHPLAVDHWSMQLLFDTLAHSLGAGAPSTSAGKFPQYAAWEQRSEPDGDAAFWRSRLTGASGVVELPTAKWRAANASFDRRSLPLAWKTLPAQASDPDLLCAGVAAVLLRYSGDRQLVLGTQLSGRHALGAQGVVGAFDRPALLVVSAAPEEPFSALLERMRAARAEAFSHPRLTAGAMADALAATNAPGDFRPPQVRVLIDRPFAPWRPTGITAQELEVPSRPEPYPLTVRLQPGPQGLHGQLSYDPGLIDDDAAARFAQHLERLLGKALVEPSTPLRRLPLLAPEETQRLTDTLNAARAEHPQVPVHALFEAQAARTPDALAVAHADGVLTYRQLDERANQLARWMSGLGVRSGRSVVLALQPGLDTIAALYGALKAGGSYVPLDPESPADRLQLMTRQVDPALVLCEESLVPVFSAAGATTRSLPACRAELAGLPTTSLGVRPAGEELAYVIFTSGSTGEPKGVQIPHRAVVNHNLGVARRFQLGPQDRVLQFTPLNFDAAGEEIYPPLLSGSAIVVRGNLTPIHEFRALIEAEKLTVLSLPPAYLQEWVRELETRQQTVPSCLRLVLLGGEKLLPESLAAWRRVGGAHVPWINVYGPTECTVTAAMCELGEGALELQTATLPIGGPVDNVRLYLVDAAQELVPFGHAGELLIGGESVGRGYLGRPDLTAEKFLPDPFSSRPGARLYRTGDVARHLPDGMLEFVGRVDHQVKIRGFRVELGEVEAALRRQPGVAEAVALAREDGPGAPLKLVAYVVPAAGATLEPRALKTALKQGLPDYMVPSQYVSLPSLPLTSNGKVDRKKLPAPVAETADATAPVRPLTPTEEALAEIWREILKVPAVGPEDDFFDLGGQSLSAMQVLSRISDKLGVFLQVQDVFEAATMADLASRVDAQKGPDVDTLSSDQVDALLAELLAKQGSGG